MGLCNVRGDDLLVVMNRSLKNIDEGNAYYSRGRYRDALNCYINGLKFDKKNVSLLAKKGNAQYQLGWKHEAYLSYLDAFFNSDAFDLIDEYVNQYSMPVGFPVCKLSALK